MKVLIVGKNSFIGNHIDKWMKNKGWQVAQLDVLTEEWKTYDYTHYDAIVHVAGIVHRPSCNDWNLYKKVNTDMPIEIATMSKEQGVKSYVYFSTMAVFGREKDLKKTVIEKNSPLYSNSMYGKSKLMAEEGLSKLQDANFNIVLVRPPSVYGKGCKGKYITSFKSIVKILPIIPRAYEDVKQSMIYIDNLAEFVYQAIIKGLNGSYCPQDDKTVCANEITTAIAKGIGKKPRNSAFLGLFVKLFHFIPLIRKAYGGIEYSRTLSDIKDINYIVVSFEEGMKRTVSD